MIVLWIRFVADSIEAKFKPLIVHNSLIMVKRSTVLLFYDKVHRRSVQVIWTLSLCLGAMAFLRVCGVFFNPKPLPLTIQEHPDYQKMLHYQQQQPEDSDMAS